MKCMGIRGDAKSIRRRTQSLNIIALLTSGKICVVRSSHAHRSHLSNISSVSKQYISVTSSSATKYPFSSSIQDISPLLCELIFFIVVFIAIKQPTITPAGQIILQTTITLRIDVSYINHHKSVKSPSINTSFNIPGRRKKNCHYSWKGKKDLPSPPKKLSATGKNTNACELASTTRPSQILK